MEELAQVIAQRTGLPADQALGAAQAAVDFIKSKLPESMAGYVDMALSSGMVDDVANQAGGLLGGLLGKKE
jgi:hypothetical protein